MDKKKLKKEENSSERERGKEGWREGRKGGREGVRGSNRGVREESVAFLTQSNSPELHQTPGDNYSRSPKWTSITRFIRGVLMP